MNLYNLPKPFFILAPMDDVTDTVFRQIIDSLGAADLNMTEFVNVDGLQSAGRHKTARRLKLAPGETKVIAQLWGLKPENFYTTAREIASGEFGPYVGIDLNMGCPEKTVVKSGACAGLIQNPNLAHEIVEATKAGAGKNLPLSIKTRLGFNELDFDWLTFVLKQQVAMVTIHGRTRKEMSVVPANWDAIGRIREIRDELHLDTLIVGNGDVINRNHGLQLADQYKLDGIMIGRGVFHDPFAFLPKSPWTSYDQQQKVSLYAKHVKLFIETWQPGDRPIYSLNKFCKIYVNGFDGAKELRERLMQQKTADLLLQEIQTAINETDIPESQNPHISW